MLEEASSFIVKNKFRLSEDIPSLKTKPSPKKEDCIIMYGVTLQFRWD